jgi:hypothetical protein
MIKNVITEKQKKIILCTPMGGGNCDGRYMMSVMALAIMCMKEKIPISFEFTYNISLIPEARDKLANQFLAGDGTHLLFVDADVSFLPDDILTILDLDKDVIGLPVSRKEIRWDQVLDTIKQKGIDTIKPEDMQYLGTSTNFVPLEKEVVEYLPDKRNTEKTKFVLGQNLTRVLSIGTGVMMIKREVFQKLDTTCPELKCIPYQSPTAPEKPPFYSYFEQTRNYKGQKMSEDVSFCYRVNMAGMETWMYPWAKTTHHGKADFPVDLEKLCSIAD